MRPGADKKKQERELTKELKAGKLTVILQGKKLKGEYALIRTRGQADNGWLLFKVKDSYCQNVADITRKDKSVISKKTINQIEKTSTRYYGQNTVKTGLSKNNKPGASEKKVAAKKISGDNKAPEKKN